MMRFFRWVRYWYRRIRYGEFNSITLPMVKQPQAPIRAETILGPSNLMLSGALRAKQLAKSVEFDFKEPVQELRWVGCCPSQPDGSCLKSLPTS